MQDLGAVFVKLGQFIASRNDIIGEEIAVELYVLYDKVKGFDSKYSFQSIEHSLKSKISDLFSFISENPIAAASIAQVHKAKLHTGEDVAVKVLRPGIRNEFKVDIKAMLFAARIIIFFFPKFKRLKPFKLIEEFKLISMFELDLLFEAANISELRDNLSEDKRVRVPEVFWDLSTSNVLVTEWINSKPIYEFFGSDEGRSIAKVVVESFCSQIYEDKFFHADMHPGNLGIDESGRIVFFDHGISCRLDDKTVSYVFGIFVGFLEGDYQKVADIHFKAGYVKKNKMQFISACRIIGEPFLWKDMKSFSGSSLLMRLFKITEDFGMETQTQLVLLQKTMLFVESLCRNLDPETNIWMIVKDWISSNLTVFKKYKLKLETSNIGEYLNLLSDAAEKIDRLLTILVYRAEKK